MSGGASNGHRFQMLPSGTPVEGANGTYRPMGYPSISVTSGPFEGALALQYAIDVLDGKKHEHLNIVQIPSVTNETTKLCKEGTWQEMRDAGCNAFSPNPRARAT